MKMFRKFKILKLSATATLSWFRHNLATFSRPPRIAVVGAGPAGKLI